MNNIHYSIDEERVYCTSAIVKSIGRAIAISLEDATLPGAVRNKHMTVLFRRNTRWNPTEIECISKSSGDWIRMKYGHNDAPVTFTIHAWGPQSVQIKGDLKDLCLHLRSTFAALSPDFQRDPHCKLFNGKDRPLSNHRGVRGRKGPKTCHICGEIGHKKRHCPRHAKGKGIQAVKHRNNNNKSNGKLKEKVQRMVSTIDDLRARKQGEIELLNEEQECLRKVLLNGDDASASDLRNEIKIIAKIYRNKRKELAKRNKRKPRINSKKLGKKLKKVARKKERRLRKQMKKEKLRQLDNARVVSLPLGRKEIGGDSTLFVHVDGYNIIGCDSLCRKYMRGKGRGRKQARDRLVMLLQREFVNVSNALQLGYNIAVNVWFDGNGVNTKCDDISVVYSSRKESVDDALVRVFGGNNSNANVLVITSDRALTLRLFGVGVKVMKSGMFYKQYLKENGNKSAAVNNTDDMVIDEEDEDEEVKEDIESDPEFVDVITSKMNCGAAPDMDCEDDETPGCCGGDSGSSSDSEDQIEGFMNDEGEEDEEYTTIYGEDIDIDIVNVD